MAYIDDLIAKTDQIIKEANLGPEAASAPTQAAVERSGFLTGAPPVAAPSTPENLRRGILATNQMRQITEPKQTVTPDVSSVQATKGLKIFSGEMARQGQTVAVPPPVSKELGKQVEEKAATAFFKPSEKTIGTVTPSDYTPASVAKFNQSGNYADLVPFDKTKAGEVPGQVKEAQSFVTSIFMKINPNLDFMTAQLMASNPKLLEQMKPEVPKELRAAYDDAATFVSHYYASLFPPPPAGVPAGSKQIGYDIAGNPIYQLPDGSKKKLVP